MAPTKLGRHPRTIQMTDEDYAILQTLSAERGMRLSAFLHVLVEFVSSSGLRLSFSLPNQHQNSVNLPSESRCNEDGGSVVLTPKQPHSDGKLEVKRHHSEAEPSRTHADKTLLSLQDSSTTVPSPLPSQEKAKEETMSKSAPSGIPNGVSNPGSSEPTLFDSQLPPATESPAPSKEAKGKGSRKRGPAKPYPEDFLTWWAAYPERTGKGAAFESWEKCADTRPPLDAMLGALSWQRTSPKWLDGYIPNPTTYLNQRRWQDEPKQALAPAPEAPRPKRVLPISVAREQAISLLARSARLHGHALEEEAFAAVEAAQDQAALDAIVRDYEQRELGRSGNGKPAQSQTGTVAGEGSEPVVLAALGAGGAGGLHVARPG